MQIRDYLNLQNNKLNCKKNVIYVSIYQTLNIKLP